MMKLPAQICALVLALSSTYVSAQVVVLPQVKNAGGSNVPSSAAVSIDSSGVEKGTASNPVSVSTLGTSAVNQVDALAVTTTPGTAISAVLFSADTSGFGGVAFQIAGTFAATVSFQASDDNANWVLVNAQSATSQLFTTAVTAGGLFFSPAQHRYFRVIVTAYTSGTIASTAYLRKISVDPTPQNVALGTGSAVIGNILRSTFYTETPVLTANGTTTGGTRSNAANGNAGVNNMFGCFFRSDQASATNGAQLQGSNDNFATTYVIQSTTLPAAAAGAGGTTLTTRPYFVAQRCVLINGATAPTSLVVQAFYGE